jgi:hypothetical protein
VSVVGEADLVARANAAIEEGQPSGITSGGVSPNA